jgi:hypothetical protein
VNNASPIAVAAVAAAAAAEIVDALIGDPSDHDVVDVFEPIDEAPFDSPGRIVFRPT